MQLMQPVSHRNAAQTPGVQSSETERIVYRCTIQSFETMSFTFVYSSEYSNSWGIQ